MRQIPLFFIVAVCLVAKCHAAPLAVSFISEPPKIDGRDEDSAWDQVTWQDGFVTANEHDAASAKTRFKLVMDDSYLHMLVRLEEPNMARLKSTVTRRDGAVFRDDSVDIMLDASGEGESFVQFIINSQGVIFDSRYRQGGLVSDSTWNCDDFPAAVFRGNAFWQVELAIPLAEIGLGKNREFGFNLCRHRFTAGIETSSFSPIQGSAQNTATFARGLWPVEHVAAYAWEISAPFDLKLEPGKRYSGKIQLTNQTGKIRFFQLQWNDSIPEKAFIDAGSTREFPFFLPYEDGTKLGIQLTENNRCRLRQDFPIFLHYSPMKIVLTSPPYRDCIFSDEVVNALEGTVTVDLQPDEAKNNIVLVLKDEQNQELVTTSLKTPGSFHLDLPNLATGNYLLQVTCGQATLEKKIRKLTSCQGEVRFTKDKVMLVNSKPVIPYGWFRMNHHDGSREGYNLDWHYNSPWMSDEECLSYLDQALQKGLKVVTYCYPQANMLNNDQVKKILSTQELELIRKRVEKLRSHPALLAWYLADEPEYEPWNRTRLEQIAALCLEIDPWHPTVIVNNSIEGMYKYEGIGDISAPDFYPGFLQNGDPAMPMRRYYDFMRTSTKLDNRVQWSVPQGFSFGDYGSLGHRVPNYTELRNMHYQSLCAGMTGLVWYSYELNYAAPSVHIGVREILKESKHLSDLWLHPEYHRDIPNLTKDFCGISCENLNGRNFIVLVNLSTETKDVTVSAPGTSPYYPAGEKRPALAVTDGKLTDRLEALQSRVYVTDQKLAESFSITGFGKEIKEAEDALHRPGNLAFHKTSGVKIETSAVTEPRFHKTILADGSYARIFCFDRTKDSRCQATLTFPQEISVECVRVYGRKVKGFEVQINGQTAGSFKGNGEDGGWDVILPQKQKANSVAVAHFDGFGISEIEVYEKAPPTPETTRIPEEKPTTFEAHWSFDHDSVECLKDEQGNMNLQPRKDIPAADFVEGISGKALFLKENSTGQYISTAPELIGLKPPFTIACWIRKITTEPRQSIVVATSADRAPKGFEFSWVWRKLMFRCGTGSGNAPFAIVTPLVFSVNTWHHVAVVCEETRATLYVDGKIVGCKEFPPGTSMVPADGKTTAFTIGHYPTAYAAYRHIGQMDDLWVFKRALTDKEIMHLMMPED